MRANLIGGSTIAIVLGILGCSDAPEPMPFFMGIDCDELIRGDSLMAPEQHDPMDSMIGVVHFDFNGRRHVVRAYTDEDYRLPDSGSLIIELEGVGVVYTCGTYFHERSQLYTSFDSLIPLIEASLEATEQPGFVADRYKYCLPFATRRNVANEDGSWDLNDVDQAPEFPGGEGKFFEYVARNQHYPDSEFNAGIEGRVFIRFTVNEDGSLGDITILRSISPGLDNAAKQLVMSMPNWTPAQLDGRNVRCRVVLPINFTITSASTPP